MAGAFRYFVSLAALASLGCSSANLSHADQGARPRPNVPVDAGPGATHLGDTRLQVKQGGDVPPQPARLDRADPPLVEAARSGDAKRVKSLLDGGADANAFGNGRTTALMAAAEGGHEEVVRALVERQADANLRNAKGQTAAEVAEANGHGRLKILLERKEVKPPPGPANPTAISAPKPEDSGRDK